jgi:hypothetical protein
MTESEWLACDDARVMVEFIRDRLSDRKARLFACVAAGMGSRRRRLTGTEKARALSQQADADE